MKLAEEGDSVVLIGRGDKRYLITLHRGEALHTEHGVIAHDDLIGQPLGRRVATHLGFPFSVLTPSVSSWIKSIRRAGQIVYPKDSGYALLRMSIHNGKQVVEAGTGSGALTIALAQAVMPDGHVYSYDSRADMQKLAAKNLDRWRLSPFVTLKQRNIAEGFDERDIDACFLDVREPWLYLDSVLAALGPDGYFGAILPTANQVSDLIRALQSGPFAELEVVETWVRHYKVKPERLRPEDRMVGHTGYLLFARRVADEEQPSELPAIQDA